MAILKFALPAVLFLAILHMLTIRVGILPGVHMPIAALVLGAELVALAAIVLAIVRSLSPSSCIWRGQPSGT
jgi:hypothetical protein